MMVNLSVMVKCLICLEWGGGRQGEYLGCRFRMKVSGKNAFNSLVRLCCGSCLLEEALVSKELYEVSVSLAYGPCIFFLC